MRAVVQRVSQASVAIDGEQVAHIGCGLLILLGVTEGDTQEDVEWLAGKIARMRIFADEAQAMNRSITDVGGQALVVSQFTLYASTRTAQRRPRDNHHRHQVPRIAGGRSSSAPSFRLATSSPVCGSPPETEADPPRSPSRPPRRPAVWQPPKPVNPDERKTRKPEERKN